MFKASKFNFISRVLPGCDAVSVVVGYQYFGAPSCLRLYPEGGGSVTTQKSSTGNITVVKASKFSSRTFNFLFANLLEVR
jgi:hypothetical protein